MTVQYLILMLVVLGQVSLAEGWEDRHSSPRPSSGSCYLTMLNDMEESLADYLPVGSMPPRLLAYKRSVMLHLPIESPSWEVRFYRKAFEAWFNDDIISARNNWLKALSWHKQSMGNPAAPSCLFDESLAYYRLATELLKNDTPLLSTAVPRETVEPPVLSEPLLSRRPTPATPRRGIPTVAGARKITPPTPPGTVNDWMSKADEAFQRGHLEQALMLYGMALKFNIRQEEILKIMAALKKKWINDEAEQDASIN